MIIKQIFIMNNKSLNEWGQNEWGQYIDIETGNNNEKKYENHETDIYNPILQENNIFMLAKMCYYICKIISIIFTPINNSKRRQFC
jgi:hypothetical protein